MSNQTTIILGAGASVDYGYPTGESLIDNIINKNNKNDRYVATFIDDEQKLEQADVFCKNLDQFDPISIDRYLSMHSKNEELVHIGKLLITCEIISKQETSKFTRNNKNNWYKYLFDYVFEGNDFEKKLKNNAFKIVTFNYDLSLEYFFHSRLEQIPTLDKEDAWKIFCNFLEKVHHVYGSVYNYKNVHADGFGGVSCNDEASDCRYTFIRKKIYNSICHLPLKQTNLRIIGEERSLKNTPEIMSIRSYLEQSNNIYILGFGFDDVNCDIIGLDHQNLSTFSKNIFATNMGSLPLITQKIKALSENPDSIFFSDSEHKITISKGNVYQALSKNFLLQ